MGFGGLTPAFGGREKEILHDNHYHKGEGSACHGFE
jgi:hypothetical protein